MPYFNEEAMLEHQIKSGADELLAKAATTSMREPALATAQLLLAAASLAQTAGISESEFHKAFALALSETYNRINRTMQ